MPRTFVSWTARHFSPRARLDHVEFVRSRENDRHIRDVHLRPADGRRRWRVRRRARVRQHLFDLDPRSPFLDPPRARDRRARGWRRGNPRIGGRARGRRAFHVRLPWVCGVHHPGVHRGEPPPPLPEESATQEPIVFPENIDDLDPIDETEPGVEELPASDETKSWIRVHYKPDVAEAIIADLEGEQGESFSDSELGFSPVSSLGGESDYYSNTCSLPKSEAMPAGCLVQVIRPMVSCEYKTIAKNVANIPTCNGVDIPQTAPKDNDHGFEWSFTKKIPTVQVHQKTCSAGYPCQTGTNKHCWKVFGKKRCASSPIMGTCHRHWSCPYTTTGTKEVGVTLKKNEMKCQRQGFVVPKAECSECLPGFVKDGNGCTSLIEAEASKLKSKAMAICEAIPKAVDKAGDVIMATLFPSDASALGDLLADVFASATGGASSSSSLGSAKKVTGPKSRSPHGKLNKLGQKAFRSHNRRVNGARRGPDTSMDIFDNPDHHHLLRDAISATLRGEHHESKAAFLGHTPDTAELGGRDCSVMPVEILDPDDFEALEGVVFDMPWPKKLESAPYAPNSFNLELPVITFKTCTSQAPMTFPVSIGKDIIQAISDFFRPLIVGGFDELSKIDCGDILKVIEDVRKEMEKILDGVTDEIKKLKKKITGRKMLETETDPLRRAAITALMDEQEDNMAEVHAKLYEEVIFSRAMALRSLFDVPKHSEWHDDFLSNPANFHKQTALLGGHGSDVHIAALGGQSFGDRLKTLGNDLKKALEGIKNIGMGWTIEQEISVSMGFAAQSDASDQFMNGEVFDSLDVANDIADSLSAEEEIPIFASLMATTVVDIEMLMPFFLLTDGKIDFSLKSGVKTSITFGVENLAPYFKFNPPTPFFKTDSAVTAALHFQQGLQFILNEFSIGICAGGTCTGPVLGFQQDVYFGVDMVAVAAAKNIAVMGDQCFRGPTTLSTNFVDWDYPASTKQECAIDATGGSFAMGAYIQVPAPQLSLVMSSWAGNIVAEIADFKMQNAVGTDDMLMTEVFHSCKSGDGGVPLTPCPKVCA